MGFVYTEQDINGLGRKPTAFQSTQFEVYERQNFY
jgi:hypothetical protein